jgi:hypothetical protein
MATTEPTKRTARAQRQSPYSPEHPRQRERFYFDDTLDAYPPYHLLRGPSTPEEIAAARAKALKRGLLPRTHPAHPDYRGPATGADATKPAKKAAKKK